MFKAAGYRIGPGEIENCLVKHPAVANAAVVPKPDVERGAAGQGLCGAGPGPVGDAALVAALQAHVRERLAPYEYPKEIRVHRQPADDRDRQGCNAACCACGSRLAATSGHRLQWSPETHRSEGFPWSSAPQAGGAVGHRVRADQGRQAQAVAQVEQSGTMAPCRCITPSTWAGALAIRFAAP